MKIFNRVVVIIGILLGIVLALLLALYPLTVIDFVRTSLDGFAALLTNNQTYTYFIIGVVVWITLMLVLLVLELRRPRRKAVRIRTKSGANAMLGIESVAQSLEYRIDELAGVRKVVPHITSRGKDVEVVVDLDTSPSVNIPVLTDQVVELCRDIVEGQLGVKIHGKVAIQVHHEPYPRGTMPPTQPLSKNTEAIATQPRLVEQVREPQPVETVVSAPVAKPANPTQYVQTQPQAAQPVRQPRFRRKIREAPPVAEPEPVAQPRPEPVTPPQPVVEEQPVYAAPKPLGDLEPLPAPKPQQVDEDEQGLVELDDLDLYDPTVRDE